MIDAPSVEEEIVISVPASTLPSLEKVGAATYAEYHAEMVSLSCIDSFLAIALISCEAAVMAIGSVISAFVVAS